MLTRALTRCYTLVFAPSLEQEPVVFLSVNELELRKARFSVGVPPGKIDFGEQNLRQVTPLEAEGTAELLGNTLGEIRVRGHLKVEMEGECDRCLEQSRFPLDSDFDLYYRPAKFDDAGAEVAITPAETEVAFYEGGGIELNDILREYVLLSLPMQKVCRETCLGICPVCGQNRNLRQCGCHQERVDDRWAALKNLKQ
jgi:uncharacterized protein